MDRGGSRGGGGRGGMPGGDRGARGFRGNGPSQGSAPKGGDNAGRGGNSGGRGGAPAGPVDANMQRLIYAQASLIGKPVRVQLNKDGKLSWVEGLFHDWKLGGAGMEVTLSMAYENPHERGFVQPKGTLVVASANFVQMVADNIELKKDTMLRKSGGGGFATDTEISGGAHGGERELVPFQMDDSVDLSLSNMSTSSGGTWDQFKVNKERFGVESGYNEDFYTTKVPQNLTAEDKARAEKLAAEIERDMKRGGTRFRGTDEVEAAGDDQGDEWASDVRAADGSTRGSYGAPPKPAAAASAKPAWGQGTSLASKLSAEAKTRAPEETKETGGSPKDGKGDGIGSRYSTVDDQVKMQKSQRKDATSSRAVPSANKGSTSKQIQALAPEVSAAKMPEKSLAEYNAMKATSEATKRNATTESLKEFGKKILSPKSKPLPPAAEGDPSKLALDKAAAAAAAEGGEKKPEVKKSTLSVSASEFVPGGGFTPGGGGFGPGGTGFEPGGDMGMGGGGGMGMGGPGMGMGGPGMMGGGPGMMGGGMGMGPGGGMGMGGYNMGPGMGGQMGFMGPNGPMPMNPNMMGGMGGMPMNPNMMGRGGMGGQMGFMGPNGPMPGGGYNQMGRGGRGGGNMGGGGGGRGGGGN